MGHYFRNLKRREKKLWRELFGGYEDGCRVKCNFTTHISKEPLEGKIIGRAGVLNGHIVYKIELKRVHPLLGREVTMFENQIKEVK